MQTAAELAMTATTPWNPLPGFDLTNAETEALLVAQRADTLSRGDAQAVLDRLAWIGTRLQIGKGAEPLADTYYRQEMAQTGRTWDQVQFKYSIRHRPPAPVGAAQEEARRLGAIAQKAQATANQAALEAAQQQAALVAAHEAVIAGTNALAEARTIFAGYEQELRTQKAAVLREWGPTGMRPGRYQKISFLSTIIADFPRVEAVLQKNLDDAQAHYADLSKGATA